MGVSSPEWKTSDPVSATAQRATPTPTRSSGAISERTSKLLQSRACNSGDGCSTSSAGSAPHRQDLWRQQVHPLFRALPRTCGLRPSPRDFDHCCNRKPLPMTQSAFPDPHRSIRRHLTAGVALVVLLLGGGVGGWAVTTELAGAVIA